MRKFALRTVILMSLIALVIAGPAFAADDHASDSTTKAASTPS
jgi:hypothetical protein